MNERIKELLTPKLKEWGGDSDDNFSEELEKFAELIIQDCGVALNPMLRDMVSRGRAVDLIKQHFGVDQ